MKIVNRISRILALVVVYIICAYGYLTAKGFVFGNGVPVLSNQAYANVSYPQKIEGPLMIGEALIRSVGSDSAPVSMYVFSSMMCSHCGDFHKNIYPKLEEDFISKGKLRFIFVHLPTDVMSMQAAKLSYCLPKDKFYGFIDELYSRRDWKFAKDDSKLNDYAKKYGFTDEDIIKCKDNKKITSDILLVRENAISKLGIQATPSFIFEYSNTKELIVGINNYQKLSEYLNSITNKE